MTRAETPQALAMDEQRVLAHHELVLDNLCVAREAVDRAMKGPAQKQASLYETVSSLETQLQAAAERATLLRQALETDHRNSQGALGAAAERLRELESRYMAAAQQLPYSVLLQIFGHFDGSLRIHVEADEAAGPAIDPTAPELDYGVQAAAMPPLPRIVLLSDAQIQAVPGYIHGRLTRGSINACIVALNRVLLFKYSVLYPTLFGLVQPGSFQPNAAVDDYAWQIERYDPALVGMRDAEPAAKGAMVRYRVPKFSSKLVRQWAARYLELENDQTHGRFFIDEDDLADNLPEHHPRAFATYCSAAIGGSGPDSRAPSRAASAQAPSDARPAARRSAQALGNPFGAPFWRNVLPVLRHIGLVREMRVNGRRRLHVGDYSFPLVG